MKFKVTFERGGVLTASCLDAAPKTSALVMAALPLKLPALQARWSGPEFFTLLDLPEKPPRENQMINVSWGDIIYFREWEGYSQTGFETLGYFYGPTAVREIRGEAPVSLFARFDREHFDELVTIGERIWKEGKETLTLERID